MHNAVKRKDYVRKFDGKDISTANDILVYSFEKDSLPGVRMLAVWSSQPYSGEFNNRIAAIRLKGWEKYNAIPVAIDLITGRSFDVKCKSEGDSLFLEKLSIGQNPILVYFIDPTIK